MTTARKTQLRTQPAKASLWNPPSGRSPVNPVAPALCSPDRQEQAQRAIRKAPDTLRQEARTITTTCPSCGASLQVDPGRIRKKLQCPKCLGLILPPIDSAPHEHGKAPAQSEHAGTQVDARTAELQARASNLAWQLEQAQSALKEAAVMVAHIAEVEARLNTLGANYVQAVMRIAELNRENA